MNKHVGAVRCCVSGWFFLLLLLLTVSAACGQSIFGNIVGSVVDPGNAANPNATVVLINKGSTAHRTVKTNGSGEYSFHILDGGKYTVTVDAPGFNHRNYDVPNMQLDSGSYGSLTALQSAEGTGPRKSSVDGADQRLIR